jgi:RimJ/RimL family protein N-acetyltransferase
MTTVLQTLLGQWVIRRMGVRKMRLAVFKGNEGSVRMFKKNGFEIVESIEGAIAVRGELRGVDVLEWSYGDSQEQQL